MIPEKSEFVRATVPGGITPKVFIFSNGSLWVMKISDKGIVFNREAFPGWTPDEFSQAVIDILQKMTGLAKER